MVNNWVGGEGELRRVAEDGVDLRGKKLTKNDQRHRHDVRSIDGVF